MSTQKTIFEIDGVVWEGHIQKAMADIEYARRTYNPESQEYQGIIRFALEILVSDVASRYSKAAHRTQEQDLEYEAQEDEEHHRLGYGADR